MRAPRPTGRRSPGRPRATSRPAGCGCRTSPAAARDRLHGVRQAVEREHEAAEEQTGEQRQHANCTAWVSVRARSARSSSRGPATPAARGRRPRRPSSDAERTGTPSRWTAASEQPDADDHADEQVGDRLADDDLPRRQRADAQQLEQPELAVADQRQRGERQGEVLQQQGEGGRGEVVDRLDVGGDDVLGVASNGRTSTAGSSAAMAGTAVATSSSVRGQRRRRGAGTSPAGGDRRSRRLARSRRARPAPASVARPSAAEPLEHDVGPVDAGRAALGGVGDRLGRRGGRRRRRRGRRRRASLGRRLSARRRSSTGASAVWPPPTTAVTTWALTSCTASRAATSIAACWIGSILSWSTSISARSPASTVSSGSAREDDDGVDVAVGERWRGRSSSLGEALRSRRTLEHVLVLVDGVLVERAGRADEQGAHPSRRSR